MKTIFTLTAFLFFAAQTQAVTYNVTSNTNWNGTYPAYCGTCTFNISSGVTLTLNTNATCYSCTINGGILTLSSSFTFQQSAFNNTTINISGQTLNLQNNGTSFTNAIVNASGSSTFYPTGSLSITGSTFNFTGSAAFTNAGGQLALSSSNLYFNGNSNFTATAGPVNLNASTQMVAGDGSVTSKAFLLMNGPTLNLVDATSAFYAANKNNYYANWNSYNSQSNSKTYATASNNKNCGGTGQNICSAQLFYGCASFSNTGPVTCTSLATSIENFNVLLQGDRVKLTWVMTDGAQTAYFKIERSAGAGNFIPLATIEADLSDAGYSYTDLTPGSGDNFYRITLHTIDGKISYSNIISIQNGSTTEMKVYPNPTQGGQFYLQVPGPETATMSIYSMDGRLLGMRSLSGQTKYQINLPEVKNRSMLVVHVVTSTKSSTFNLLNN